MESHKAGCQRSGPFLGSRVQMRSSYVGYLQMGDNLPYRALFLRRAAVLPGLISGFEVSLRQGRLKGFHAFSVSMFF